VKVIQNLLQNGTLENQTEYTSEDLQIIYNICKNQGMCQQLDDDDSNPQDGRENRKSRKERSLWRETYQKTKGSPMEPNMMWFHSADRYRDYDGESYESEDEGEDMKENDGEDEETNIDPNDLTGNVNELFRHIYNEEKKQV